MLYQLSYIHRSGAVLYTSTVNMQAFRTRSLRILLLIVGCGGCAATHPAPSRPTPDRDLSANVAEAHHMLLGTAVAYGPVVSFDTQTRTRDGMVVTARAVKLEDQPWNVWPDGSARLLNDAQGYAVVVAITGAQVRWDPAHTELAVNTTDQVFPPASTPEELLTPLLLLARYEAQLGLEQDTQLRLRSAEGFRSAYLSTKEAEGQAAGIVVFPAPAARLFAVALQLTLGVIVDGKRMEEFTFLFE